MFTLRDASVPVKRDASTASAQLAPLNVIV